MSQPLPYPGEPAPARPGPALWMASIAIVVALLAAGAAAWALLKPAPEPPGNPAAADPKATACNAFFLVSKGVALQSRKDLGPEPAAQDAVAANARLSMAGGAAYLRDTVPSNTPPELAEPLTTFADQLQTIAQYYLAGMNNNDPEQAARLAAADETTATLLGLCK
ncbi:hypothetical protein [Mycolicibacterium sp.]|uniref:hypothetical protein n=1 Tax=Mycolicibacterium sp. TaxID=2320850 RepID=UPI001DB9E8A6|nr:hypothetical protein [Mycolicibacterium sp.]MCB1291109.1 hypothetical protein [Mycobacterium sp.]MCB9409165.1 hypothetical protein [Mycolicibacterium sp.]